VAALGIEHRSSFLGAGLRSVDHGGGPLFRFR
jgi:hypothetical protein